jgi:hypothetical protein
MRFLSLLLLALLPALTAFAAEPEAVYAQFHRAVASGNLDEMLRYAPDARRAEMAKISAAQKEGALKMMTMMMPRAFTLRDKTVSEDGKAARLVVAGPADPNGPAPGQLLYGTVRMMVEKGDWKVSEVNWSPEAPTMLSPVNPGGAYSPPRPGAKPAASTGNAPATPGAPAAKPAAAAPPRAAPLVGSTTGAPERKLGTAKAECVYKPVMTAEDMANCK